MSKNKDMLGPVTRALVGVRKDRLPIVADIANRLRASDDEFYMSLADFMRNGAKMPRPPVPTSQVWREITVYPVGHKNAVTIADLNEAGFNVDFWAEKFMAEPAFKTLTKPKKLKLKRSTVLELGFSEDRQRVTFNHIRQQLKKIGGKLCPPELGPALRLDYADQPDDDRFELVMEQITTVGGNTGVFQITHNGDYWLDAVVGTDPDHDWPLGRNLVYVLGE